MRSTALTFLFVLVAGAQTSTDRQSAVLQAFSAKHDLDLADVAALLKAGVDINAVNGFGRTPLMIAVSAKAHINVVTALLNAGANVNAVVHDRPDHPQYIRRSQGITALMIAVFRGSDVEVVRALLRAGAQVDARLGAGVDIDFARATGWTPLMIASLCPQLQVIEELLKAGANVNASGEDGTTALMLAAGWLVPCGQSSLGGDYFPHPEGLQSREILAAVLKARASAVAGVKVLVKTGANVNASRRDGSTALMIAATGSLAEAVDVLVEAGANVNATDLHDQTVLLKAERALRDNHSVREDGASAAVVERLRKAGANVLTVEQLLKIATRSKDESTVREIFGDLGVMGASFRKVDIDQMVAFMRRRTQKWETLSPREHCVDHYYRSASHYAARAVLALQSPYVTELLRAEAKKISEKSVWTERVSEPGWV